MKQKVGDNGRSTIFQLWIISTLGNFPTMKTWRGRRLIRNYLQKSVFLLCRHDRLQTIQPEASVCRQIIRHQENAVKQLKPVPPPGAGEEIFRASIKYSSQALPLQHERYERTSVENMDTW